MADIFQEFNIFNGGSAPFQAALPAVAAAQTLVLPVACENTARLPLYALIPHQDGGLARLQAFTDVSALTTQFIQYQSLEAALILFHAKHDSFIFDPGLDKESSVIATRADISLLIGCLQAGNIPDKDLIQKAAVEFSAGNLHKSHYFYSLASKNDLSGAARLPLCAALIELGLYQEATDILKTDHTPQAMLLLAAIHRLTGNMQLAAETLAAIGPAAPAENRKAAETAWLYIDTGREDEAAKEFKRLSAFEPNKAEALTGLGTALAKKAAATKDSGQLAEATAALEAALKLPLPGAWRTFFQLGNMYTQAGNLVKAELCYRQAAGRFPGLQVLTNLATTLICTGKILEVQALTTRLALTHPEVAVQLAEKLQAQINPPQNNTPACAAPAAAAPPKAPAPEPEFELENFPAAPLPPEKVPPPSTIPKLAALEPAAPHNVPKTLTPGHSLAPEFELENFPVAPTPPAKGLPPASLPVHALLEPAAPIYTPGTLNPGQSPAPEFAVENFPAAPTPPAIDQPPAILPGHASLEPAAPHCTPQASVPGHAPAQEFAVENFPTAPVPPPQHQPFAALPLHASLEPAAPRNCAESFSPGQRTPKPLNMETLQEAVHSGPGMSAPQGLPEDFMSGAFNLASALERESGSKVRFNREGLEVLEAKLRSAFAGDKARPGLELVKDCAAFICYFLQERHKGRLIKLPGIEPWGWPMIFEHHGTTLTTYPTERAWRLILEGKAPEPGWLVNYYDWLITALQMPITISGELAVKFKAGSHPQRLADTATEHRRMLLLASNISEISDIKPAASNLFRLADAIRKNFTPDIPPSADGWRMLRCYGHILAEMLAKDFAAAWYNTDGEDGVWSMRMPWGTFVFPLGKVYKVAAAGQDLSEYYATLLSEKPGQ